MAIGISTAKQRLDCYQQLKTSKEDQVNKKTGKTTNDY